MAAGCLQEDRMPRILVRPTRFSPALAAVALLAAPVFGDPPAPGVASLTRIYGTGVHAYFAGDYPRAYDDLSQAIEAGTEDPRTWYFRGLAASKLGRLDEAEADFSAAAVKEAQAVADWRVSRALERIQGRDRMQLERHRMRARMANLQRRIQADERRYNDTQAQQPEVRRRVRPEGGVPDALGMFSEEPRGPAEGEKVDGPTEPIPPPAPGGDAPVPDAEAPLVEQPSEPPPGEPSAFDDPGDVKQPMADESTDGQPAADEQQPAEPPMVEAVETPPDAPGGELLEN